MTRFRHADRRSATRIREEAGHYDYAQAACVEALKIVQEGHRWVSDEHLKEVAELLDMSPEALDSVATFYNLIFRKPVGENVILLCDSVSCWIMGYEDIRAHLKGSSGSSWARPRPTASSRCSPWPASAPATARRP